jgi:hypothetical protein
MTTAPTNVPSYETLNGIPPIDVPANVQAALVKETVQNLGGEQEQNQYLALGMGWSRWPERPEARSSGKLFTPRFWTVSCVPGGRLVSSGRTVSAVVLRQNR